MKFEFSRPKRSSDALKANYHINSLGYFPFQPVSTTGLSKAVVCTVLSNGKVHIKDPLLLIEKSSLCVAAAGFLLKKCVNVTI